MKSVWAERQVVQINPLQAAMCDQSRCFCWRGDDAVGLKADSMLGVDKHGVHYTGVGDVFRRTWRKMGKAAF
jgi:hypothetical protein